MSRPGGQQLFRHHGGAHSMRRCRVEVFGSGLERGCSASPHCWRAAGSRWGRAGSILGDPDTSVGLGDPASFPGLGIGLRALRGRGLRWKCGATAGRLPAGVPGLAGVLRPRGRPGVLPQGFRVGRVPVTAAALTRFPPQAAAAAK